MCIRDRAMAVHHIDFVPGSVELADFDATSTTIAGDPAELLDSLPPVAVQRTFEKFDSVLQARRTGQPWTAYTPYEVRAVGTKVRLGWRESALAQLKDLLACLLYTSDAADERSSVDLGGRRL